MPTSAYITASGNYLPGQPIGNEEMESYLGAVNGKESRLRKKILKSNGIVSRHYAMDREQRSTHQNSELAANAIEDCLRKSTIDRSKVDMLAVATTQGDLPLPGMASVVQAILQLPPCEILTTHGVCSSSMMALKSATNAVRLGDKRNAMVCASELSSRLLKKSRYEALDDQEFDFEAEFLRWMLSDGAGAMLIQDTPRQRGLSLRIDWIDILSFASSYDLCMSCGTTNQRAWTVKDGPGMSSAPRTLEQYQEPPNGKYSSTALATMPKNKAPSKFLNEAVSWQDYDTYAEAERAGALLIRQNLNILQEIVKVGVDGFLRLINAGKVDPEQIDHFVCHYSSQYFRNEILKLSKVLGCYIPEEKWFTNLYTKGNTGAAALFIALDELLSSGKLTPGQVVFCVVPESGRFCTAYAKLTVVEG
jgi:3-oxoacyl-[acyl-carrier-protein] synthase III